MKPKLFKPIVIAICNEPKVSHTPAVGRPIRDSMKIAVDDRPNVTNGEISDLGTETVAVQLSRQQQCSLSLQPIDGLMHSKSQPS